MEIHFKKEKKKKPFVVIAVFIHCQINRKGRWLAVELQMFLASLFCTSMGMGQNLASFFVFQINYNKIPKSIHTEAVN